VTIQDAQDRRRPAASLLTGVEICHAGKHRQPSPGSDSRDCDSHITIIIIIRNIINRIQWPASINSVDEWVCAAHSLADTSNVGKH